MGKLVGLIAILLIALVASICIGGSDGNENTPVVGTDATYPPMECINGLPNVGLNLGQMASGILALSLKSGACIAEIFKAGIKSIKRGHMEVSFSPGMTSTARRSTCRIFGPKGAWCFSSSICSPACPLLTI